jgi:hypothetical protein
VAGLKGEVASLGRDWGAAFGALEAEVRAGTAEAKKAAAENKKAIAATLAALANDMDQAAGADAAVSAAQVQAMLEGHAANITRAVAAAAAAAGGESRDGLARVEAEMACLFEGLATQQAGALHDVLAALDDLSDHVSAVEAQATALGSAQLRVLGTLLSDYKGCPPLVAIVPKGRKAGFKAAFRGMARSFRSLGSKSFKATFLCSLCNNNRSCGPNGHGYTFDIPSEALRLIAPVATICIKILVIAAKAGAGAVSGGAVVLSMPGGADAEDMLGFWAEFLVGGVESTLEELDASVGEGGGGRSDAELAKLRASLTALTGDAYAKLTTFLGAVDKADVSGIHKHLGLEFVDGGSVEAGTVAKQWVCKVCKPGFTKDGASFKPDANGGQGAAEEEGDFPPLKATTTAAKR